MLALYVLLIYSNYETFWLQMSGLFLEKHMFSSLCFVIEVDFVGVWYSIWLLSKSQKNKWCWVSSVRFGICIRNMSLVSVRNNVSRQESHWYASEERFQRHEIAQEIVVDKELDLLLFLYLKIACSCYFYVSHEHLLLPDI